MKFNSPHLVSYANRQFPLPSVEETKKHLDAICRGIQPEIKSSIRFPQVIFLDRPEEAKLAADALAAGWAVVQSWGATYGTTFLPKIRDVIAHIRKETEPLATVSAVTSYDYAVSKLIDFSKIHPVIQKNILHGQLKIIEDLAFIRLPVKETALCRLHPSVVNSSHEIQLYFVPNTYPLLTALKKYHHTPLFAVRSSNITGYPEEYTAEGAMVYATEIGATLLILPDRFCYVNQEQRQRTHSQPILHIPAQIPSETPSIICTRSGNTHPEALKELLKNILKSDIKFIHNEEKIKDYRVPYNPLDTLGPNCTPVTIRQSLLQASGLS